jgi:hypothetical protein
MRRVKQMPDPIINSPGWMKVHKFCGNCGTPITVPTDTCPQCGFWFEAYDNSIIEDETKAQKIREAWRGKSSIEQKEMKI